MAAVRASVAAGKRLFPGMVAEAVALAFLIPASLVAAYYVVLTVIGIAFQRDAVPPLSGLRHSFGILIPAHNEEKLLPRCLRSIPQTPQISIVVVADNCIDETPNIAHEMGATCVVRHNLNHIGKGFALAHGLPAVFSSRPDGILILDADGELAPGTMEAFDAALSAGECVVQAPVIVRVRDGGESSYVAAVGAEVDRAVLCGLDRIGGSVPLHGTGMLFRRDVLESHPWSMHGLAEDAEFTAVLRRAGLRVRLLDGGTILAEAPARTGDLLQQRRRWSAALRVPGLGWASKFVTSKPLILGHLAVTTAVVLALTASIGMRWWLCGIVLATAAIYLRAMLAAGVGLPGISSAILVARLAGVAISGLWKRDIPWQRTARG